MSKLHLERMFLIQKLFFDLIMNKKISPNYFGQMEKVWSANQQ
mgnify:CR=1 FL=1|jgi:hypothetical protein